MGKYGQFNREQEYLQRMQQRKIHPIWRGVGFLVMVIIPIVGYLISLRLMAENELRNWFTIPAEYMAQGPDPLVYVKVGLTVLVSLLLFMIFMLIGLVIVRNFGPPRYGPLDAPPAKHTGARKRL